MKKYIRFFITLLLIFSLSICSVSAAGSSETSTTEIIELENGTYIEIVTTISSLSRSNQKYATKEFTCKTWSGSKIVGYLLKGWFEYDGNSSKATAVEAVYYIYHEGWDLDNHLEYCSGSSVYGAAKFDGPDGDTVTLTGSITCDKDGNIS